MREITADKFFSSLQEKAFDKKFPLNVTFELTYDCNFRCVHCYISKSPGKEYLTTEQVFKIIDGLTEIGCLQITLTGGEIFLRRDIFEIIEYAARKGFYIVLLTNGSLLNAEKISRLHNLGIRYVEISLLGDSERSCSRLTGEKGYFPKVVSNIKLLREKGIGVNLKTCVLTCNLDRLRNMNNLAKRLGARFTYSLLLMPKSDGDRTPLCWRVPAQCYVDAEAIFNGKKGKPRREIRGLEETLDTFKSQNRKNGLFRRSRLFNCGAGKFFAVISPYGKLNCCIDLPLPDYDLIKGNMREGWQRVREFVANSKPGRGWKCKNCVLWNLCDWCPARGYLETGDIEGCPEYFKEAAILRAKRLGLFKLKAFKEKLSAESRRQNPGVRRFRPLTYKGKTFHIRLPTL